MVSSTATTNRQELAIGLLVFRVLFTRLLRIPDPPIRQQHYQQHPLVCTTPLQQPGRANIHRKRLSNGIHLQAGNRTSNA